MKDEIQDANLKDLRELLDSKKISSRELAESFLDEVEKRDESYQSYLTVVREQALDQADQADKRIAKKENVTPLTGIPMAIKDVIAIENVRTTAGSKFLEKYISPYDATVTSRLREAGAVFLGKTNCDEFAMGSSNENSAFHAVKNPWNLKRVPGGSSGGSAAAVAGRIAPCALGSDTGGSIRQPAALCGVVGLKPTYGRISRYGLIAFASSLDQIGPMTRQVEDSAILYESIAGHDKMDSTSAQVPVEKIRGQLNKPIKGTKIGFPKEFLPDGLSKDIRDNFQASLKTLEGQGAKIEEISLPHTEYGIACYYIVATAEASSNLARFDGVHYTSRAGDVSSLTDLYTRSRTEGFGKEVQRRILLGTYVLSSGYYDAYYLKGQKVRTLIRRDFENAFKKVDVIVSPTSPTPAFELGSKVDKPLEMYLNDIFTVTVSLAGLPALSVPSGFVENLPVGLQLIGRPFDEKTILQTAFSYEAETRFFERRPPE